MREIRVGIEAQIHNNSRRLWDWIDKQLHHVEKQAMAIRDPNTGVLHTDEETVAKLWSEHYRKLGSKEDGHSKDASYWIGKPVNKPENEGMCANEKYWDADINWFEVREAVRVMSNGKAAGNDGIPGEVYKAIMKVQWPRHNQGLACVLLELLNTIFYGNIPEKLMTSTVVSVPKKGDLTDMNN